jgi:hypothetical protein
LEGSPFGELLLSKDGDWNAIGVLQMENPPRKNAAILNVLLLDFNNQVFFQQDNQNILIFLIKANK